MSGDATKNDDTARGEAAARLPSLEEQTPGLDTDQERRTEADARAFFEGGAGAQTSQGGEDEPRSELERRSGGAAPAGQGGTPVTDTTAAAGRTGGAQSGGGSTSPTGSVGEGQAEGREEGQPPAGDVRAAYSSDRAPGEAKPKE